MNSEASKCECGSGERAYPLYDNKEQCVAWACDACLKNQPKNLSPIVNQRGEPQDANALHRPFQFKGTMPLQRNDQVIGVGTRRKVPIRNQD